ncbi:MAG: sensor histidine kinase [Saprospiraceae bacterium]|nr:sensor histidine kinase [Saprospiraceae bacterium]
MTKRITYHILFWVAYVLFKAYLNYDSGSSVIEGKSGSGLFFFALLIQLVFLIVKIPLVYSLFFATNRFLSRQWNIVKTLSVAGLLFAAAIFGYMIINQVIVYRWILHAKTDLGMGLNPFSSISYYFFILAFVSGIAISIKLIRLNIRQKEVSQEILRKKLETELQFLKSQTNPHFLFNTLNNIYALARKKSDATADAVMKLSKLLRFMLYESQKKYISISDEIQVLDDFIELEKIRYGEKLQLNFKKSIDNESHPIAPLILLPFVENAFKHGASESRFDSFINIDLNLENSKLCFKIENSNSLDYATIKSENIGLNNIRRQLELLYPEHLLEIDNKNNTFRYL